MFSFNRRPNRQRKKNQTQVRANLRQDRSTLDSAKRIRNIYTKILYGNQRRRVFEKFGTRKLQFSDKPLQISD